MIFDYLKTVVLTLIVSIFIACGGGGGSGDGDDGNDPLALCEDGCLIVDVCYDNGETNPANTCQICNTSAATDNWSDNDGASCDDGDFCTTGDSCLAGACSENSGNPCGAGETCLEDEDTCCLAGIPEYLSCNDQGDVASFDECGEELSVVTDCPDLTSSCNSGICSCVSGWTGDDCDQCVVYVDQATGENGNTGRSWDQALATVQAGVYAAAADRCQVWIAAGTYFPTVETVLGEPRSKTVALSTGLAIYGGFGGFETDVDERDPSQYETIISGDIGTIGDSADNTYNVVTGADGCILDGITIAGGNADDAISQGGGLMLSSGTMTVVNCLFDDNRSDADGGGIFLEGGELTITGSRFTGNDSLNGGGILCRDGSLAVDGSEFVGNSGYGGGIGSRSCDCTITNSRFLDNDARYWAGAVSINSSSSSVPPSTSSITNCVFVNNRSEDRGGAAAVFGEVLTVSNSTFTLNRAERGGAGLYVGPESDVTFSNTIFWNNSHPDTAEGSQIQVSNDTASVTIGTSLIQGGCSSIDHVTCLSGNRTGAPNFIDARAGDVRLRYDSAAIDRGEDASAPTLDIDGLPRYQDPYSYDGTSGYSDIGAHEFDGAPRLIRAFGRGTELTAVFSKPITELPGGATYTISDAPTVTSSEIDSTGYRVELTLDTALVTGESYTLSVAGVVDEYGMAMSDGTSTDITVYRSLVDVTFNDNLLPDWHYVDDAGALTNAPSDWAVADQVLYQRSNIYGESGDTRYGTRMLMQPNAGVWPIWTNYLLGANIVNGDNDGVGLVFRHHGENLYYKVDLDSQRSFTRLYMVHQDSHTILAESAALPYLRNTPFNLRVEVHNAEMWVFINNESVFNDPVINETTTDRGGNSGIAGLYTWGSGDDGDVIFDNVQVIGH